MSMGPGALEPHVRQILKRQGFGSMHVGSNMLIRNPRFNEPLVVKFATVNDREVVINSGTDRRTQTHAEFVAANAKYLFD